MLVPARVVVVRCALIGIAAALAALLCCGPLAWRNLRRFRRATRGEAWFLGVRRYVLRGYARRRDGRAYHPARNPEVGRLDEAAQP